MTVLMRKPQARSNNLFERFFDDAMMAPAFQNATLVLDVVERENEYVVTSPVAGVNPEHIDIKLDDDVLTISAEINETASEENTRTLIRERRYGKFSRSLRFGLPVQGDAIEAEFENGLLTVHVPKAEASQPKKISVKYNK